MNYLKLSKEISYILRHNPSQYSLELDDLGYVEIEKLLNALNATRHYPKEITLEDLFKVIELSDKKRLEISSNTIRALYGHSIKEQIIKSPATPPLVLYHGTSHNALEKIIVEGLKPMQRQYVHLSIDIETAIQVGKRRDASPIL
ncbi:MAG: RNA 2'-phosphotransferase, partial [Anaeroplasmataceae bacterium]|nr:RNA 2'-phosphotransferase [Anaeroplasmataceae bacterium]